MNFIQTIVEDILNPLILISIALFLSLGYLLTRIMPVSIDEWTIVLYVSVAIALVGLIARLILNRDWLTRSGFFDIRIFLPVIPLAIFVPAIQIEFSPDPMLQILNHGDIHLGYVHQLLLGTTPVENVFIAGYPANYYWLYHALIATLAHITGVVPAVVASAVNVVALFSSLLWVGKTLVALGLVKHRSLRVGLMAIVALFAVNLPGVIHGGTNLFSEPYDLNLLRTMLIEGGDRRLYSALPKFFAFSSASLGFMLFSAAVYAIVKLAKSHFEIYYLALISAVGIASLAAQQLVVMYVVLSLIVGMVFVMVISLFLNEDKRSLDYACLRSKLKSPFILIGLVIWGLISLGLSIPLLQYNIDISYNYTNSWALTFLSTGNMSMILAALYVLIPLYILHILRVAYKPHDIEIFVVTSTFLSILVTVNVTLMDDNQYKGVFFVGILMTISVFYVLWKMQESAKWWLKSCGYIGLAVLILLALSNVGYINYYMVNQSEYLAWGAFTYKDKRQHFSYIYDGDKRAHAYRYIYNNTPPDAVVITPNDVLKFSSIMYERPTYVKPAQFDFVSNIEEHPIRLDYVNRFYNRDASFEELQIAYHGIIESLPNRLLYAVVKEKERSRDIMEQLGAVQVYDNEGANVYLLNPNQ